ncbi:MAG: response regulator [Planctomycetota bacterium]|jgi:CheY-like chemotaxis protein
MNGFELLNAIRADEALSDLPIIAVTAVGGETAKQDGEAAGFNRYLLKLDRTLLVKACKEFLTSPIPQEGSPVQ